MSYFGLSPDEEIDLSLYLTPRIISDIVNKVHISAK